jgi:hypothetical protein
MVKTVLASMPVLHGSDFKMIVELKPETIDQLQHT